MTTIRTLCALWCGLVPTITLFSQHTAWFHVYANTNARCSGLQRSSYGDLFIAGDIRNDNPFDGQVPEWYAYNDGYIGRTDPMGIMRWIHAIGAFSSESVRAIREFEGRITMIGHVTNYGGTSNINYNGTSTPITADGEYLMQVDTTGNLLWLQQPYLGGDRLEVDAGGNIHYFVVENGLIQYRKVDQEGDLLQQFVVSDAVHCHALAISPAGDLWVAGSWALMNPGPVIWAGQTFAMQPWDHDIFLAKFDPTGVPQFATRFRSSGNDLLHDLAVSADGTVHMSGVFGGIVEQDGDTLAGTGDRWFLASFDPTGNLIALDDSSFRTRPAIDIASGQLRVNDAGEVLASLNFADTLFHAADTMLRMPTSPEAGILAKWNAMGQLSWYRSFGEDNLGRINSTVTLGSIVEDSVFIGGRAMYAAFTALVIDTTYAPLATPVRPRVTSEPPWHIFPNPATDHLTVIVEQQEGRLQLIGPLGRILLERVLRDGETHLDLSSIPSGCYILHLSGVTGSSSKRVLVMK